MVEAEAGVQRAGMSHYEVARCLPGYAAGTLDDEQRRRVQAHLAEGCEACLQEVFRRPVGQTRPAPPPAPAVRDAQERSTASVVGGVLLALILATGVTAGLLVRERHLRTTTIGETLARVSEAVRAETELRDRLVVAKTVLRTQRRIADAEQAVLARGAEEAARDAAEAARDAAEASREAESLRERLQAGRRRVAQLEAELVGGRLADDVIAGEGLELRPLHPAPAFRGVNGHVLWRPSDGEMVVYANGLPGLPSGVSYEARVIVDRGRTITSRLRRRADGRAFAYLVLPASVRTVHAVEVRRATDARRVLLADAIR